MFHRCKSMLPIFLQGNSVWVQYGTQHPISTCLQPFSLKVFRTGRILGFIGPEIWSLSVVLQLCIISQDTWKLFLIPYIVLPSGGSFHCNLQCLSMVFLYSTYISISKQYCAWCLNKAKHNHCYGCFASSLARMHIIQQSIDNVKLFTSFNVEVFTSSYMACTFGRCYLIKNI